MEHQRFDASGGYPVLVHHGLIGSASVSPDAASEAARRNIELIALARPGYGRSAPQPMTSIGDWHGIVTPLLDTLGIERYSVWGTSAGAPYAYALAAPDRERVGPWLQHSGKRRLHLPRR
ncbi:alpha/beta fold hydrolase [Rhodococcus sp. SMB37]|uniref:alpha/beta fold hydrolase n=1 Tax=Rhodococcus sp. SMB37 TaxID=2512213 RepID=UPI001046EA5F|nr:alpha/beta fold hydrolase [Rhodococcus sp. SMB37]